MTRPAGEKKGGAGEKKGGGRPRPPFSREHYRELSGKEAEHREQAFVESGFPIEGPALGAPEDEAAPGAPAPLPSRSRRRR